MRDMTQSHVATWVIGIKGVHLEFLWLFNLRDTTDYLHDMSHSYVHMCDMTHAYARHDSFIQYVTWLIHYCDMTHSYVWRDSSIHVTHPCMWHDSSINVAWLIHMCDVTHPCVWHDLFIRVAWLIYVTIDFLHILNIFKMCMRHVMISIIKYTWCRKLAFICVTWLTHSCDMSHSYVWHDSYKWQTHPYAWHNAFIFVT